MISLVEESCLRLSEELAGRNKNRCREKKNVDGEGGGKKRACSYLIKSLMQKKFKINLNVQFNCNGEIK